MKIISSCMNIRKHLLKITRHNYKTTPENTIDITQELFKIDITQYNDLDFINSLISLNNIRKGKNQANDELAYLQLDVNIYLKQNIDKIKKHLEEIKTRWYLLKK